MKNLRITLVQIKLKWENAVENHIEIEKALAGLKKSSTDLIILPEMFTTGFTMNASTVAETMEGITVHFMKRLAKNKKAAVCGSVVIAENKKYFNRLIFIYPDGKVLHYDKRHLFRMANEHKTYSAGTKKLLVEVKGWKICPLICYDLRFPVWSRSSGDIDLLIYVANWPARRKQAWSQLLIARAIENQCYVAGVNRVGKDGNGITYSGNSIVHNFFGDKISSFQPNKVSVETIELDYKTLQDFRKQFPVMMDADKFKITN